MTTLAPAHTIDLTPVTDAFMVHAIDSLERAERHRASHTRFSAEQNFIWTPEHGSVSVLNVRVLAEAFMLNGCYTLQLIFTGSEAEGFLHDHKSRLTGVTTTTLETNGWVLAALREDQGPNVSGSRQGIFFTLTKRSEEASSVS